MKKIIISLIILIISISCYCQEHIAKDILENLRKKTQTYQNITINFDLNYIWGDSEITNKKQISNTKSGTLTSQEDKFILEFDNQILSNTNVARPTTQQDKGDQNWHGTRWKRPNSQGCDQTL